MLERVFYNFGSFYATVESDNEIQAVIRVSMPQPLELIKKAFTSKGIKGRIYNPHTTHVNPISSYWIVEK